MTVRSVDINNEILPSPNLRLLPIGGLGEVGKNMMVIESGDDIVLIDAGLMFPHADMFGVDFIVPDIRYLLDRIDKVRAILITHGHEDHIGAIPHILTELNVPVYAPPLACSLINLKLKEGGRLAKYSLRSVSPGDVIQLGQISAEYIQMCHSIPDACGIALKTSQGVIFHTGDFKIDHTPVSGKKVDLQRLGELGKEGVLLMLSDSTYAEVAGYTPSESVVGTALDHAVADAPGRIILATFASLISRVQQLIDAAAKHNRKVAPVGRGMVANVSMAIEQGYIKAPSGLVMSYGELSKISDEHQIIVTTGSQGEPASALARIANKRHNLISIHPGDTIIISASPIPGNERHVFRIIDSLRRQGAKVLYSRTSLVHVQGHASQEELKTILNLVQPRYFVPIHGEYRMLAAHADLAKDVGVLPENVFVLEDGDVLELEEGRAGVIDHIDLSDVYLDGPRRWSISGQLLRERRRLASDGFVVVGVTYNKLEGSISGKMQVLSAGFLEAEKVTDLVETASDLVQTDFQNSGIQAMEWSEIKPRVTEALESHFYKETGRRPLVVLFAVEN